MIVNKRILQYVGKEDFELDESISFSYIVSLCYKYGRMLIRGLFFSLFYTNISKNVFIGKHVKVKEKRRIKIGNNSKLYDNVYIDALSKDGVTLGKQVVLGRGLRIECTGGLRNIGKGIIIGDRSTFGNDCFFGAAGGIEIGDDVVAGQFIRFHAENHNYKDLEILIKDQGTIREGIKIGNNCWIGSGVVFLDGAEIGDGCVVAANAVVTKKFPPNSIIGGLPAKIIKKRGE